MKYIPFLIVCLFPVVWSGDPQTEPHDTLKVDTLKVDTLPKSRSYAPVQQKMMEQNAKLDSIILKLKNK